MGLNWHVFATASDSKSQIKTVVALKHIDLTPDDTTVS
jgi:hypothetical protein